MNKLGLYTLEELKKNKRAYVQMVEKSKLLGYENLNAYMEKEEGIITTDDTDAKFERLKEEIKKNFQGNSIEAREIYTHNLYYKIRKICSQKGITVHDFITGLGYRYEWAATQVSKFDYDTLRRMHREYMPNQSDISRLFEANRQVINNIIKYKVNESYSGESWLLTSLDEEQEELILEMIIDRVNEKREDELCVNIICDGKGKILFVFKTGDCVKVIFDENVPLDLHELLDEVEMSKLFDDEREFLNKCSFGHVLDKRVILKNNDVNRRQWEVFKKNYYKRRNIEEGIDFPELDIYGFINERDLSFEKIMEILTEVSDEENGVVTTNKDVSAINQHYRHYRLKCEDALFDYSQFEDFDSFLNYHGFHLKGHHAQTEETKQKRRAVTDEKYRKILREYIVIPGTNIVSFSSYDPVYGGIFQTAVHRGMNISSYASFLGYDFVSPRGRNELENDMDIFEEIFNIYQTERIQVCVEQNQYQRNKELVAKLKKAYQYKCQLCADEENFVILQNEETGEKYVEVHHIIPNCEGEDEEGTLDRPDNLIVVCPNHHRFLHYHLGGNYRLELENEVLYLRNEKQSIEVKCDKHLKKYMKQRELLS